ncbi:MAG: glycosyltransferase family 4 protein, partial [Bacteroidales bacterium]
VKQPILLIKLLGWILTSRYSSFSQPVKCIALIPVAFMIIKQLQKVKPQVVHLFWGHFPSMVGYLARLKLPETKVSMFLGAYDIEMKLGISAKMAYKADLVVTHSAANLPLLEEMGISGAKVIHRGINTEKFKKLQPDHRLSGHPKIVTASRLIKGKGIKEAIEVIAILKRQFPDIKYYIAGEGPEKQNLMDFSKHQELTNNIVFLGHIEHDRVTGILKSCDIFLLLSRYKGERLPNGIKEAMYAQCVPVTTVTPGIDELISHGEDGLILDRSQPEVVAEKISRILNDKKRFSEMQEKGQQKIEVSFNSNVQMNKYLDCWKSVL